MKTNPLPYSSGSPCPPDNVNPWSVTIFHGDGDASRRPFGAVYGETHQEAERNARTMVDALNDSLVLREQLRVERFNRQSCLDDLDKLREASPPVLPDVIRTGRALLSYIEAQDAARKLVHPFAPDVVPFRDALARWALGGAPTLTPEQAAGPEVVAVLRGILSECNCWEHTDSKGELRQTVRNVRDNARAVLAKVDSANAPRIPSDSFRVRWEIDIDAENARQAAEQALAIHRDPDSIATVFDVIAPDGAQTRVDLSETS